jgi:hypothetical protein
MYEESNFLINGAVRNQGLTLETDFLSNGPGRNQDKIFQVGAKPKATRQKSGLNLMEESDFLSNGPGRNQD